MTDGGHRQGVQRTDQGEEDVAQTHDGGLGAVDGLDLMVPVAAHPRHVHERVPLQLSLGDGQGGNPVLDQGHGAEGRETAVQRLVIFSRHLKQQDWQTVKFEFVFFNKSCFGLFDQPIQN